MNSQKNKEKSKEKTSSEEEVFTKEDFMKALKKASKKRLKPSPVLRVVKVYSPFIIVLFS